MVLRAQKVGIPVALAPLVMVVMNLFYSVSAYPFGKLSDRMNHRNLLIIGLFVLIAADILLAIASHWVTILVGVVLWGAHMGITQGLLSAMVAGVAPADLRGTAYGIFSLVCGIVALLASIIAGLLWDKLGAPATFFFGAGFCVTAIGGLFLLSNRRLIDN